MPNVRNVAILWNIKFLKCLSRRALIQTSEKFPRLKPCKDFGGETPTSWFEGRASFSMVVMSPSIYLCNRTLFADQPGREPSQQTTSSLVGSRSLAPVDNGNRTIERWMCKDETTNLNQFNMNVLVNSEFWVDKLSQWSQNSPLDKWPRNFWKFGNDYVSITWEYK